MRLQAALQGDLHQLLAAELKNAERGVTTGVRRATDGLKAELRARITGAGLGKRLARAWRSYVESNSLGHKDLYVYRNWPVHRPQSWRCRSRPWPGRTMPAAAACGRC